MEPVSLLKPISQAIGKVGPLAQQREVKLEQKLPAILPLVKADEHRLAWVIEELLENAVKYTPAGGLVTIGALNQSEYVKVGVIDSGEGIPREVLDEAFLPFHQRNGASSRMRDSSGLGLALARRIIEAHGTQFDVRSKAGWGSQFTFRLPVAG